MAITFPSNPSISDTHVVGGITWTWNGSSWDSSSTETDTLASVTSRGNSTTGPITVDTYVNIEDGALVVRTDTGNPAYVDLYCEVGNAHRTRIKSAAHASYSGNVELTLPTTTGTLALTSDIPTNTDALNEGSTNVYYTDARVDTHLNQSNPTAGYVLSWDGADYAWVAQSGGGGGGGVDLTAFSVGAEAPASGDGGIAYDNTTGVFTYTPPTAGGIGAVGLTALSVGAEGTPSGNGALSYNNTSGVFTYTPPTIDGMGGVAADTSPQLGANLDMNSNNITGTGAITITGDVTATNFITTSDARLKSNITNITDALAKVTQLSGKQYTMYGQDDQIGLIAQEVEQVLPQMVHTRDDMMGTKAINYQNMVALLVEAVKELQTEIKGLKGTA